jgi:hypothetical protein
MYIPPRHRRPPATRGDDGARIERGWRWSPALAHTQAMTFQNVAWAEVDRRLERGERALQALRG